MSGVGAVPNPDDLEPEHTEGFKVGEKKTIEEYQNLGKHHILHTTSGKQHPFLPPTSTQQTPHPLLPNLYLSTNATQTPTTNPSVNGKSPSA